MADFVKLRKEMVSIQIYARGVRNQLVLEAIGKVPREQFVLNEWRDHAYEDRPLPIAADQTISQPYIVAFMIEALALGGGEKVLEIGAGSGYAAAVLAEIASEVFAIERIGQLAQNAASALGNSGYKNVHVLHDDGTKGWLDEAPFDAILVSAGAPNIPETLKNQLATGGRMVVPVGIDSYTQELVRITRREKGQFDREDLADVRFVPLIGKEGWPIEEPESARPVPRLIETRPRGSETLPALISRHGQVFDSVDTANLDRLIERVGDRRIVLLGEASHGTSEFYRMRDLITRRLAEDKGFTIVAIEADWPDAAHIDNYVRNRKIPPNEWEAFGRFPTWMWRNHEMREFANWLHHYNSGKPLEDRTAIYGLDLYSLYISTRSIIDYLDRVDVKLADVARQRYGCLTPWQADPAAYGQAALSGAFHNCEKEVTEMLADLMSKRQNYADKDGANFLDAAQNAALVANAEKYYRIMFYGSRASWNLRDAHMFHTLQNVMQFHGQDAKAVVWAHNSHIGDASATEMAKRGETNLGEMCVHAFGENCYRIGFGTDHGTVAAASSWDGPMEIKHVQPSHRQSYERQFHLTGEPGIILPMRAGEELEVVTELANPRLERAIGVIYSPETEISSHYFEASLPKQFNEYIWIDRTSAVSPLPTRSTSGVPDTYPFGI